jgi:hypothetical protein
MTNDELDALVARLQRGYPPDVDPFEVADAITALRAERDAAFKISRCECGADECCANLVKLHNELAAARAENESLRADCGIRQIKGYNEGRSTSKSEIDELRMKLGISEGFIASAFDQRDKAQADLAAARELIREARDWMPAYSMRDRIDAFLARAGEPTFDPTANKDHDWARSEDAK